MKEFSGQRRRFLKTAGAAGLVTLIPESLLGQATLIRSDRLTASMCSANHKELDGNSM